ncbi:FAD-dependent oxidoreductase [Ilumatobacter sp.]|uniref:FAD-dependent oxidoreductase n=1 Tax=Ilumatobacter sp. TaxID=1967498 RepID=UPI003B52AD9E
MSATDVDVAIIGAGSAGEALVRGLEGSGLSIVMFEPRLVGGECPFLACMPSKSMLHDAKRSATWETAVERRDEVVSHLDDSSHREDNEEKGATIVSAEAKIVDDGVVEADGRRWNARHVVIATGADAVVPDIDGLDTLGERMWTSEDALTTSERPERLGIIGGGIIGGEVAQIYSGFGSTVTMVDTDESPAEGMHPRVGEEILSSMERAGVRTHYGVEPTSCRLVDDEVVIEIDGADVIRCDVVLVVVGRRPSTDGLGLESLGLDPTDLDVDDAGRVAGPTSLWIMGDAAGREQYTHVANRHAAVVADHLRGDGDRSFGASVVPACQFIDPPLMVVGPTCAETEDDPDVVWSGTEVDVARLSTDELPSGFLALAASRSSRCLVAAHGIGPRFDEIVHALVVAIDGQVPLEVLARTIQPFPTVGECLGVAYSDVIAALDAD